MKKSNKKTTVLESVYSLDPDELEAVAFVSSRRLEKYLCSWCKNRYGFPKIHFRMDKSEKTSYLDEIFCSSACFLKWVAENSEKLDEDMTSLQMMITDEEENGVKYGIE